MNKKRGGDKSFFSHQSRGEAEDEGKEGKEEESSGKEAEDGEQRVEKACEKEGEEEEDLGLAGLLSSLSQAITVSFVCSVRIFYCSFYTYS